jgi:hypothetical protein
VASSAAAVGNVSVRAALREASLAQGWSTESELSVVLDFIEEVVSVAPLAFRAYLTSRVQLETVGCAHEHTNANATDDGAVCDDCSAVAEWPEGGTCDGGFPCSWPGCLLPGASCGGPIPSWSAPEAPSEA